jgi:hypothetical protein
MVALLCELSFCKIFLQALRSNISIPPLCAFGGLDILGFWGLLIFFDSGRGVSNGARGAMKGVAGLAGGNSGAEASTGVDGGRRSLRLLGTGVPTGVPALFERAFEGNLTKGRGGATSLIGVGGICIDSLGAVSSAPRIKISANLRIAQRTSKSASGALEPH